MNDIAPRRYTLRSAHAALFLPAIGRGCPTLRLLGESLLKTLRFTADDYVGQVMADYRPDEASFAARWAALTANLKRFKRLSDDRSARPPLFVILPFLVRDFDRYPAKAIHQHLAELARSLGFEVFDLLANFRATMPNGAEHRVSKDDIHFDRFTHELVARAIKAQCDRLQHDGAPEHRADGR